MQSTHLVIDMKSLYKHITKVGDNHCFCLFYSKVNIKNEFLYFSFIFRLAPQV